MIHLYIISPNCMIDLIIARNQSSPKILESFQKNYCQKGQNVQGLLMIPKMKEHPLGRNFFSWLEILALHNFKTCKNFTRLHVFINIQTFYIFKISYFLGRTPVNLFLDKSSLIGEMKDQ